MALRALRRGLLVAAAIATTTCASGVEIRPPCSALDPDRCWTIPDNPALHCDSAARIADANLDGFTHQQFSRGHTSHALFGPGDEPVTPDEQRAFYEEHWRFAKSIPGVRVVTPGCSHGPRVDAGCMSIYVDHCTGPTLDELAKYVRRWAKGIDAGHKRYTVVLHVGGNAPRCQASDPTCAPLPYDKGQYRPGADRVLIEQTYEHFDLLAPDERPCVHDGDCTPACHDCESWVQSQPFVCSQEYRTRLTHALCGCIAGHCHWFSQ